MMITTSFLKVSASRTHVVQLMLVVATLSIGHLVAGSQSFQTKIPNGASVTHNGASWPAVGHMSYAGGGTRNSFGVKFASEGHSWTMGLCMSDDDNDGYINGAELGDPACIWSDGQTPQRSSSITHPSFPQDVPTLTEFVLTGYLADRRCVDIGTAADGANMSSQPFFHTVKCALMPPCVASGYTILVDKVISNSLSGPSSSLINNTNITAVTTQDHRFVWMYNLTESGNAMAVKFLNRLPFGRRNILVSVKGIVNADRMLDIASIVDISPQSAAVVRVTGYLADRRCVDNGTAADGANMTHEPYKHTVNCALMPACVGSGYTLLVDTNATNSFSNDTSPLADMPHTSVATYDAGASTDGFRTFVPLFNLTAETNFKAVDFLKTLPLERNNVLVAIHGVLKADGMIDVATIVDVSPKSLEVVEITGFIADRLCVDNGTAADGSNMTWQPFKHTAKCALMPACVASGYTILIPGNWTNTSVQRWPNASSYGNLRNRLSHELAAESWGMPYVVGLNLSTAASEKAVAWLKRWPGPKNNLLVSVQGWINGNGTFDIISIKSESPRFELTGYVADRLCVDKQIAFDGSNMSHDPYKHSVKCALMTPCKASGYTLLVDTNTSHSLTDPRWSPLFNLTSKEAAEWTPPIGHVFNFSYNFTGEGNKVAVKFLEWFPDTRKNIFVRVIGELQDSTGLWSVQQISDIINRTRTTGYLADRLCVNKGIAADGSNMRVQPYLHTTKCALMPPCIESGYTLLVDEYRTNPLTGPSSPLVNISQEALKGFTNPGVHNKFRASYNLSAQGNTEAVAWLKRQPMTRRNLLVTITGQVHHFKNGTVLLDVARIEDSSPLSIIWTGFVADILCVNNGIAADGANMTHAPYNHTAKCALMPPCIASGYTLLSDTDHTNSLTAENSVLANKSTAWVAAHKPQPPHRFQRVLNLTAGSNAKAVAWLHTLPMERNNLLVAITGVPRHTTPPTFEIVTLRDLSPRTALYYGFIADRLCVDNGIAADGANMTHEPYKHTAKCALMPPCVASGYTLLVDSWTNTTESLTNPKTSPLVNMEDVHVANFSLPGPHRFKIWFNISRQGNAKIVDWLNTLPSDRNNLFVGIQGTVLPNGTLDVFSIVDVSPKTTPPEVFEGFLADRLCVDNGIAADGANMVHEPYKHTVKCALMPPCILSGYTLLVDQNQTQSFSRNASSPFAVFNRNPLQYGGMRYVDVAAFPMVPGHRFVRSYNLTMESNMKVVHWLQSQSLTRNNIFVRFTGELSQTKQLSVLTIQDIAPKTLPVITVVGYLADTLCVDDGFSVDGVDMLNQPYKHTVKCALMPACKASGYTILVDTNTTHSLTDVAWTPMINMKARDVAVFNATGIHRFRVAYTLSSNTIARAIKWLETLPASRNNILVEVKGGVVGGKLEVVSIRDLSPKTSPIIRVTGYLADRLCVDNGIAADGANMTHVPFKHTVKCALMPPCVASGYTLLIDTNTTHSYTNFTHGWFTGPSTSLLNKTVSYIRAFTPPPGHPFRPSHNLTAAGNEVAVDFLKTLPPHRNNIIVDIEGSVISENVIDVISVKDLSPATAPVFEIVGYVADRLCVDNGVAADGANMKLEPFKHTAKCALMPPCIASGYTLLVDTWNTGSLTTRTSSLINLHANEVAAVVGSHIFTEKYNFTAEADAKIVDWLRSLLPGRNNLLVALRGAVTPGRLFDIVSIEDLSPKTGPSIFKIGQGMQGMFTGFHGGGIVNSLSSNLSEWETLTGLSICEFDGVGYRCDFSPVIPKMAGLMDMTKLPPGITHLKIDNQDVEGTLDLRPPFLAEYPFLNALTISRNAMTGNVQPATFSSVPSHVVNITLAFNKLSGPLTLTSAPHTLRHLDVSGNNLTTGAIAAHNLSRAMTLALDRPEDSRRRFTSYTPNKITTVSWECRGESPTLHLLLSDGTFITVPNGSTPVHCENCTTGSLYNVAHIHCPLLSTPIFVNGSDDSFSGSLEFINTTVSTSGSYCDKGCVGVIIGITVFLVVMIIIAVIIRVACKPKPAPKSVDHSPHRVEMHGISPEDNGKFTDENDL